VILSFSDIMSLVKRRPTSAPGWRRAHFDLCVPCHYTPQLVCTTAKGISKALVFFMAALFLVRVSSIKPLTVSLAILMHCRNGFKTKLLYQTRLYPGLG
jgi:hypothetical protein